MLVNYLQIAWKVMLRRPFFTFVSLFGIALTMVVIMVAVSLLDHSFGPMPPESGIDRIVGVYGTSMSGPHDSIMGTAGYKLLDRYIRTLHPVEGMTVHSGFDVVYSYQTGQAQEFFEKRTDGAFWRIFDFSFVEGGPFTEDDNRNRNFVAVVNESTLKKLFGAGAHAAGKTIELGGQNFQIVGVVRDVPFLRLTTFSDVWVPLSTAKTDAYKSELVAGFMGSIQVKDKKQIPMLRAQLASVLNRVELPLGFTEIRTGLDSPFEALSRMIFSQHSNDSHPGRLTAILLGVMVLFMLLPTINLVNINLSRILERASEIGVRKAFGASSWVLVGQFVVENVTLTLIGSMLGLLGAILALRLLTISAIIPYAEYTMNYRIFGYAVVIAVFFGVLSGAYPAWRMARLHVVDALRGGAR